MSFQSSLKHEGHKCFFYYDSSSTSKTKQLLIDSIIWTFGDLHFNQQWCTKRWNKDNNKKMMMMMFLLLQQLRRVRKRVWASNQAQCISTTLFCICGMWCCLKPAHRHCVSPSQVKHCILGSKLSLGWNERWNLLLSFHLHPLCPTRTCCRGKNKSTSLFFPALAG